jgi:hypothetical protein
MARLSGPRRPPELRLILQHPAHTPGLPALPSTMRIRSRDELDPRAAFAAEPAVKRVEGEVRRVERPDRGT